VKLPKIAPASRGGRQRSNLPATQAAQAAAQASSRTVDRILLKL